MRLAFALALAFASASAFAEDAAPATATNTVCPVSGKPIDKSIALIDAKTSDGKDVKIGVCCNDCPATIKADPAKYADAAAKDQKYTADAAK